MDSKKIIVPIDLGSILAITNGDLDPTNQLIDSELEKYSREHGIPFSMLDWEPMPAKETR